MSVKITSGTGETLKTSLDSCVTHTGVTHRYLKDRTTEKREKKETVFSLELQLSVHAQLVKSYNVGLKLAGATLNSQNIYLFHRKPTNNGLF